MHIIFITNKISIGGVAIVTNVLSNKFASSGHHVSIFAFNREYDDISYKMISPNVKIYFGDGERYSNRNVKRLHDMFLEEQPDIIVNQWGLHWFNITCIRQAMKNSSAVVVTVYHNAPSRNGKLEIIDRKIAETNNRLKRICLRGFRNVIYEITALSMRYVYCRSDKYLLLSESYRREFSKFTGIKNAKKIEIQTNPITIDTYGFDYSVSKKYNEIIFVGRIDNYQKRVHRIIEIWKYLEYDFSGWQLTIVGDGEERANIERMIVDNNLKNVNLVGFQQPRSFYERSKMLLLTSEFEGFPLVLTECMSFGVVPVVYGSYSAVYDIIEDGKDGIIIPKRSECFNAVSMAECIKNLIEDDKRLNKMALAAIDKSRRYSVDKIYKQWMELFRKLKS